MSQGNASPLVNSERLSKRWCYGRGAGRRRGTMGRLWLVLTAIRRWIFKELPYLSHRHVDSTRLLLGFLPEPRVVSEAVGMPYANQVLVRRKGVLKGGVFGQPQGLKVFAQRVHALVLWGRKTPQ